MASSIFSTPPIVGQQRVEEAFSPKKYLGIAVVAAGVAAAIFQFSFAIAMALLGAAAWYLWSAIVVVVNRASVGTTLFEKIVHRVHAFVVEMNSGITSISQFPLCFFKSYHGPKGNPHGRPILMVNGYLSSGSVWNYQRPRLAQAGLGPIYTMNVGTGKSIAVYAEEVRERVKQIQKETGRNDIDLIGHSKGGLVIIDFTTRLAKTMNVNVANVVTIGSPLAGTPMAHLVLGQDGNEMRTDSPFHQELRDRIKDHAHVRFLHVASETDGIVPLSSALLGDPSHHYVLKDVGHLSLVFSSRVADQISDWLK